MGASTSFGPPSVPADADATRSAHFGTLLRDGTAVKLSLGMVAAVAILAVLRQDPDVLTFGLVAAPLAVLLVLLGMADSRAARDFFTAYARSRGLTHADTGDLLPVTPLLGAGDRRSAAHLMAGTLPGGTRAVQVALYTYETRRVITDGDNGRDDYEPHHFTVCLIDLPEAFPRFSGVYLQPRSGPFRHDWLGRAGHRDVELESIEFHDAYRLRASGGQDPGVLRELFAPALLVRLVEHPLRPGLELGAGGLCVYAAGKLEDAAGLDGLLSTAADLLAHVERELAERSLIGG